MDDNSRLMSNILEKKTGNYDTNYNNFVAPAEITVTVTLAEYRALVANNATRDKAIDDANKDKYSRELEIKSVKEENARLKGENYDLKTQLDALKEQIEALNSGTAESAGRSVTHA